MKYKEIKKLSIRIYLCIYIKTFFFQTEQERIQIVHIKIKKKRKEKKDAEKEYNG